MTGDHLRRNSDGVSYTVRIRGGASYSGRLRPSEIPTGGEFSTACRDAVLSNHVLKDADVESVELRFFAMDGFLIRRVRFRVDR